GLCLAMLVGAAFETAGLGLLVPFVESIANPGALEKYGFLKWLPTAAGLPPTVVFGIAIGALFIVKNLYLAALVHVQTRWVFAKTHEYSVRLFRGYLSKPYQYFLHKNSSDLLMNIGRVSMVFDSVLLPLLNAMTEVMVTGLVGIMLLKVAPLITLGALAALGLPTYAIFRLAKTRRRALAVRKEWRRDLMARWVTQGLSAIKETKVRGCEDFFLEKYSENALDCFLASGYVQTSTAMPKLFVEALAVLAFVGSISVLVLGHHDLVASLPVLGVFVIAMVRLMPSMTRIMAQLASIHLAGGAVALVARDLEDAAAPALRELPPPARTKSLELRDSIDLQGITFVYDGTEREILDKADLTIRRGESIGLIGPSGAGKTTLVDMVLGLLEPTAGKILVDGKDIHSNLRGWQRNIGYIPQTIYLTDDTIRRNVAFGVPDEAIDDAKVWEALKAAQLEGYVRELPKQLDATVGERGVRMSGGQRQRIGIARALYHDPDLLVLDEATSALDSATELEVTRAIESLTGKKTLIVIAHRLTTVEKCTRLLKIANGKIENERGEHKHG
ncbi:MAG: ABC transporter ATP-binding protein, partial [Deltaproteobacteria bacterium]|nr:ABC transporter ATP-binding protein [Deltaproteobacteria bacterium]